MTRRWTSDNEERAAVAQKAHDAYAAARQAQSRVDGLESRLADLEAFIEDQAAEIRSLRELLRKQSDNGTVIARKRSVPV